MSCRLSRISVGDKARTRAAASSMASGRPSSLRQISVTASVLSAVRRNSGLVLRARSLNSSIASSASDNDGTRQLTSPGTPIGSRLVVSRCQRRAGGQQGGDQLGAGVEQVFAVVEHHQHAGDRG